MSDATLVTGSSGARALRRGDVLGERYEILEALEEGALVCTYRGNDQESDATVLVRCTAPGLLGERDARRLVERGKALVGGGGRVLSPLRDVDREGAMVFTVEAWPRGTSLRAVLDARRAKGTTFEPREMLPVIARLAAAVASIPEPWWHGDVRAERVWVDPDGLVLTGGFLVSLLPGDAVAEALRHADAVRAQLHAPELADGMGGRASDRWGAAAIVWEAMTGRPVEPSGTLSDALGPAAVELARLLSPDPAARTASLDGLVAKIAELARMSVPRVELDPFPVRGSDDDTSDEATQVAADLSSRTERPPAPVALAGFPDARFSGAGDFLDAPTERSSSSLDTVEQDLEDEDLGTDPAARPLPSGLRSDDTAPHEALGPDGRVREPNGRGAHGDLDPRLVRAALAEDEIDGATGKKKGRADDLDPRLVRAALGIVDEATPAKPQQAGPPRKSAGVTQELDASELQPMLARGTATPSKKLPAPGKKLPAPIQPPARAAAPVPAPAPAPAAVRKKPVRPPEPVALPTDIKPIPRPRPAGDSGEMSGPVLFDASRPQPARPQAAPVAGPPVPRQPQVQPAQPLPAQPLPAHSAQAQALHAQPSNAAPALQQPPRPALREAPRTQVLRAARRAPPWASWAIVVGAVVIGLAIIAGGFWYRAQLQREADQQQFIEQRLRELQEQR